MAESQVQARVSSDHATVTRLLDLLKLSRGSIEINAAARVLGLTLQDLRRAATTLNAEGKVEIDTSRSQHVIKTINVLKPAPELAYETSTGAKTSVVDSLGKGSTAGDVARRLKMPKPEVNAILYSLRDCGVVVRSNDHIPVWTKGPTVDQAIADRDRILHGTSPRSSVAASLGTPSRASNSNSATRGAATAPAEPSGNSNGKAQEETRKAPTRPSTSSRSTPAPTRTAKSEPSTSTMAGSGASVTDLTGLSLGQMVVLKFLQKRKADWTDVRDIARVAVVDGEFMTKLAINNALTGLRGALLVEQQPVTKAWRATPPSQIDPAAIITALGELEAKGGAKFRKPGKIAQHMRLPDARGVGNTLATMAAVGTIASDKIGGYASHDPRRCPVCEKPSSANGPCGDCLPAFDDAPSDGDNESDDEEAFVLSDSDDEADPERPYLELQPMTPEQAKEVQDDATDYDLDIPMSSAPRDHAVINAERKILEDVAYRRALAVAGARIAKGYKIVDVGGNPNRHAELGRKEVHCLCPVLEPADLARLAARSKARNNCDHELGTEHRGTMGQKCDCVDHLETYLFTHSLYYFAPADLLAALDHTASRTMWAIVHHFDKPRDTFPWHEAVYEYTEPGIVEMKTRIGKANAKSGPAAERTYRHSGATWLRATSFGGTVPERVVGSGATAYTVPEHPMAMSWQIERRVGSTFLYRIVEIPHDAVPTGLAHYKTSLTLNEALGDGTYVGDVDLDPARKALLGEAPRLGAAYEQVDVRHLSGTMWSFGSVFAFFSKAQSGGPPVILPKDVLANVAIKIAYRARTAELLQLCKSYVTSELNTRNLTASAKLQAVTLLVPMTWAYNIEGESAAIGRYTSQPVIGSWLTFLASPFRSTPLEKHSAALRINLRPHWIMRVVKALLLATAAPVALAAALRYAWWRWGHLLRFGPKPGFTGGLHIGTFAVAVLAIIVWILRRPKPPPPPANRKVQTDVCVGITRPPLQAGARLRAYEIGVCKPKFGNEAVGPHLAYLHPAVARRCVENELTAVATRAALPELSTPLARAQIAASAFQVAACLRTQFGDYKEPIPPIPFEEWVTRDTIAPPRREQLRAARLELMHTHESPADRKHSASSVFVKRENQFVSGERGVQAFNPRLISPREAAFVVSSGPYFLAFGKWFANIASVGNGVVYASGITSDDIGVWYDIALNSVHQPRVLERDRSRFDGHLEAEFLVMMWAVHHCHRAPRETLECLKAQLTTVIRSMNGLRGVLYAKRKSGDTNTSCDNSFITAAVNAAEIAYAADRMCDCVRTQHCKPYFKALARFGMLPTGLGMPRPLCRTHNPFSEYAAMTIHLGDDMLAVVSAGIRERIRGAQFEELAGWVPEEIVREDPCLATFCSCHMLPVERNGQPTWMLSLAIGRVLGKSFWSIEPVPLRLGLHGIVDAKALAARRTHARGVALGFVRDVAHLPILRVVVAKVLHDTRDLGRVKELRNPHSLRAREPATCTSDTYVALERIYGLTKEQFDDVEEYVRRADPWSGYDHPYLRQISAVDTPDVTLTKKTLDVVEPSSHPGIQWSLGMLQLPIRPALAFAVLSAQALFVTLADRDSFVKIDPVSAAITMAKAAIKMGVENDPSIQHLLTFTNVQHIDQRSRWIWVLLATIVAPLTEELAKRIWDPIKYIIPVYEATGHYIGSGQAGLIAYLPTAIMHGVSASLPFVFGAATHSAWNAYVCISRRLLSFS